MYHAAHDKSGVAMQQRIRPTLVKRTGRTTHTALARQSFTSYYNLNSSYESLSADADPPTRPLVTRHPSPRHTDAEHLLRLQLSRPPRAVIELEQSTMSL